MIEPLTTLEVERLEIHANYLGRQARGDLADILRRAIALATQTPKTTSPGWAACKEVTTP